MKTTRILALSLALLLPAILFAQAVPINPQSVTFNLPPPSAASRALTWISLALAVIGGVSTWWHRTQLTGARKIIGGIAEGVEAFTATSVGSDLKKKLESTITARVNQADPSGGLGKILNDVVDEVTPHVRAELDALTAPPALPAIPLASTVPPSPLNPSA